MKTKLIDKNLFFEGLHQLKTAGLICFLISIIGNVLSFIFACIIKYISYINKEDFLDNLFNMTASGEVKNGVLFFNSISCGVTAIYVFTPIFTFLLFKFLFKRNASDFYHSLSVKRETLFFTFSLSALVMTLSIVAVCGLFSIIANGFILNILDFSSILPNFLNIVAGCLLIQSAITIGCSVSGRFFPALVASTMIVFYPRIFITALLYTIKLSTPVVNLSSFDMPLGNSYNVLTGAMFESYMEYKSVIYSIILAAIYYFVAIKLFAKRKSEDARVAGTSKRIKAPMRIAFCLLFCLPSIIIEYLMLTQEATIQDDLMMIIPVLVFYFIAIVAYFLIELFSQGKYKKPLKIILQLGWVVLLNVLLIGGLYASNRVIINYTPTKDTVESVSVAPAYDIYDERFKETNYDDFFENTFITDKETISLICTKYNYCKPDTASGFHTLKIGFKEGNKIKYRVVSFTRKEFKELSANIKINDDYLKKLTTIPENIDSIKILENFNFESLSISSNPINIHIFETAINELKTFDNEKLFKTFYRGAEHFYSNIDTYVIFCYDAKGNEIHIPVSTTMKETQKAIKKARVYEDVNYEELEYALTTPENYSDSDGFYNDKWVYCEELEELYFNFKQNKSKELLEYIKTEGKNYKEDKYLFVIEYEFYREGPEVENDLGFGLGSSTVTNYTDGEVSFFIDKEHINEFFRVTNYDDEKVLFE